MITLRQYHFATLWIPLIIPVSYLLFTIVNLLYTSGKSLEIDNWMFINIFFWLYFFPYILFIIIMASKKKIFKANLNEFSSFGKTSPIYFTLFYCAYFIVFMGFFMILSLGEPTVHGSHSQNFRFISNFIAYVAPIVFIVSYLYVALAYGLGFLLKKTKLIKE